MSEVKSLLDLLEAEHRAVHSLKTHKEDVVFFRHWGHELRSESHFRIADTYAQKAYETEIELGKIRVELAKYLHEISLYREE